MMMRSSLKTDCGEGLLCHLFPSLRWDLTIDQWKLNIFQRRCPAQQVESLKDKTDFLIPYLGQFVPRKVCPASTLQKVFPTGRMIQKSEDIHEGRFPGACTA